MYLVDTNVIVYAYDTIDAQKQAVAAEVLNRLGPSGDGAISAQILGELYVTLTRKLRRPLTSGDAEREVSNFARSWRVLPLSAETVTEAMAAVRRYQLSYWDGLIWASAARSGIPTVLSEDFSSGSRLGGVRFVNPFTPDFDTSSL